MRYLHDCDKCVPLGEYRSGLCFANTTPELHEAKIRAIDIGLLR